MAETACQFDLRTEGLRKDVFFLVSLERTCLKKNPIVSFSCSCFCECCPNLTRPACLRSSTARETRAQFVQRNGTGQPFRMLRHVCGVRWWVRACVLCFDSLPDLDRLSILYVLNLLLDLVPCGWLLHFGPCLCGCFRSRIFCANWTEEVHVQLLLLGGTHQGPMV